MRGWGYTSLFVLCSWTVVVGVCGVRLAHLWELRSASSVDGLIVAIDSDDHDRATYRYRVRGVEYTGQELPSRYHLDEAVTVYYVSERPWVSTLVEPREGIRDSLKGMAILCVFFAAGGALFGLRTRSSAPRP